MSSLLCILLIASIINLKKVLLFDALLVVIAVNLYRILNLVRILLSMLAKFLLL